MIGRAARPARRGEVPKYRRHVAPDWTKSTDFSPPFTHAGGLWALPGYEIAQGGGASVVMNVPRRVGPGGADRGGERKTV